MLKKSIGLLIIALTGLAIYSCKMPTAIEIKANPKMSVPASKDLSELFSDAIHGAFPEDFDIYDATEYKDSANNSIQAFVVRYPVFEGEDLNLNDRLSAINDNDLGSEAINQSIVIPSLDASSFPPQSIEVVLDDLFDSIQTTVNTGLGSASPLVSPGIQTSLIPAPLTVPLLGPITLDGFNEATFSSGELKLEIMLDSYQPGVKIELSNIYINDAVSGHANINSVPSSIMIEGTPKTISFPLAGKTLANELFLNATYTDSSSTIALVQLSITPQSLTNLKLKSASGVDISSVVIPITTADDISLDMGTTFVHAEVRTGSLALNLGLPSSPSLEDTSFSGFTIDTELYIKQDDTTVHGNQYSGLSNGGSYWKVDDAPNNLNGKHINTSDIEISPTLSKVTLSATSASFRLSSTDQARGSNGMINVDLTPTLNIEEFATLHVDISDITAPSTFSADLSSSASYVESITFSEVGVQLEFEEVIPGLEMSVSSTNFGITDSFKSLISSASIEFINTSSLTYTLSGDNLYPEFTVKIQPTGGGSVLTLTDISPGGDPLEIIGTATFISVWTSADINMGTESLFSGKFPENEDEGIDLSSLNDYLEGFNFDALEAKLYISGPESFKDLTPSLKMEALYNEGLSEFLLGDVYGGEEVEIDVPGKIDEINALFDVAKKTYTIADLPAGGTVIDIRNLLNQRPSKLQFKYDVTLGTTTITPGTFTEDSGEQKLSAELIILLPLQFKVDKPEGADIKFPDLFEAGKDLFGRKAGEDSMLDMIKSLNLEIRLNGDAFTGGKLVVDNTANDGPKLEFPLSGNSLKIPITSTDLDAINKNPIFAPEIGIHFLDGSSLRLPRNLGATGVSFEADIDYRIEL
ncbi:hypothetical protein AGMMS50293_01740 [Spirochaetia bacterium]|nr:hypothetical protein AGMMS50293_01740 [Spirochaetia bacterium]